MLLVKMTKLVFQNNTRDINSFASETVFPCTRVGYRKLGDNTLLYSLLSDT